MGTEVRTDYHDNVRRDVFPLITKHGGVLLDVGGGVGGTARAIRQAGMCDRVGVIDLVAPPVELGAIDFSYAGSLEDASFLDRVINEQGPFDTILCLDVLEHLIDPWATVAKLHRSMKVGGTIVTSLPNVRHLSVLAPLLLKGSWKLADEGILDRTHLRFFVKQSAIELMTSSGLKLEIVKALLPKNTRAGRVNRFTAGLFEDFLTVQYAIRVRRTD
jgi:2-polyprenyl-3-methyl-5-hydroxy-6-metoxy-1,4-benzoquinol methylase